MSLLQLPRAARAATLALLALVPCLSAQTPAEARTLRAFEAAKKSGAPALYTFLKPFPKGADLHMHFSGAVYAETFIANAIADNLCVDPDKLVLVKNTGLTKSLPPQPVCPDGAVAAAATLKDNYLYDKLVDNFSLRSFVPYAGWSGHDQFFSTFDHFGGIDKSHQGQWLEELTTRAAAQNEQYLEIMTTPSFNHVFPAIEKAPWPADLSDTSHMAMLAEYRHTLLANGLREDVAIDSKELADVLTRRSASAGCENPLSHRPLGLPYETPGDTPWTDSCGVQVHFLYQVLRGFPPAQVFAQTLLGFELASAHPDQVVGINFVRAEDRRDAMAEYHTEMLMLDYLHSVYPKVHISLHAGELAPGLVPPEGLRFHIREAVELGHAERIGHGVDILYEDNPTALFKEMAARHIDVEINLISNQGILGVVGTQHPLSAYRTAHVPFSLSTDDEGVSRTDLTHNYVQAVLDQHLTYADLKLSARNSLEHSFLPGPSLYAKPDDYTHRIAACATPSACKAFLATSEKATQQYELELRFAAFEAAH